MKKRILFVCIHNSARSQMAETFVNKYYGDQFEAESAGIEPGSLNPVVVKVMQEIDIDISSNDTSSVQSFIDEGRHYDYVVTVCDETNAERCPTVPGGGVRVHFGFPDPSGFKGGDQEKLEFTRGVRDQIKNAIDNWIKEL